VTELLDSYSSAWKAILVLTASAFGLGQAWLVSGHWIKRIKLVRKEREKLAKNTSRLRKRLDKLKANPEPKTDEIEVELYPDDAEEES
jgi:hypothetical protein